MPKKNWRYTLTGSWFKGNTHLHSTASDGGKTFPELEQLYSGAGYDFLFRTDHWVCSDVAADAGPGSPLLWLDGVELDGRDNSGSPYHVVALGRLSGLTREMGLHAALESARAQGAMLILAHPQWMGNTLEEACRWQFDAVEVYNHVCRWLNGKGDGVTHWHAALTGAPNTLALAVDDGHIHAEAPGWNGGWVMVNAPECSPQAITAALRAGNYYSTCGPVFHEITYTGTQVSLRCSPVQFARLVGPRWNGARCGSFDGSLIEEAVFTLPEEDWAYAYLEIEDAQGRRAWSNPLFLPAA
jgi:hypothetical protein